MAGKHTTGENSPMTPRFAESGRPAHVGACRPAETVSLPDAGLGAIRIEDFFTPEAAKHLSSHLIDQIVYERDEIDDQKLTSRAARDGELPDSPLRYQGVPDPVAQAALAVFEGAWFIEQLENWLDRPLCVLRPSTPYRLDPGDYINAHDDRASDEFRLSVTCALTPDSIGSRGGETVVGLVDTVTEYEHPDFFFPLKKWTFQPGVRALTPRFNSLLLIPLEDDHAHAVRTVREAPRYSITTLYGDRPAGR